MSKQMLAAVVREFGKPLVIEERPIPEPREGQILVMIMASGVCHTDVHAADGDWPVRPTLPIIPGHEGVGIVAALGKGVTAVREGDRVGIPWLHSACGFCEHCLTGWETLCHAQQNTGYTVDGGYAEYALADPQFVGRLPPTSPLARSPRSCVPGPRCTKGSGRRRLVLGSGWPSQG
jgi:propanol-preferring alcohol dehydrogenase